MDSCTLLCITKSYNRYKISFIHSNNWNWKTIKRYMLIETMKITLQKHLFPLWNLQKRNIYSNQIRTEGNEESWKKLHNIDLNLQHCNVIFLFTLSTTHFNNKVHMIMHTQYCIQGRYIPHNMPIWDQARTNSAINEMIHTEKQNVNGGILQSC